MAMADHVLHGDISIVYSGSWAPFAAGHFESGVDDVYMVNRKIMIIWDVT